MNLRDFTPSGEQISAAELVFLAMAHLDLVRPVVQQYKTRILAEHQFRIDPMWVNEHGMDDRVILDPKDVFLLSDEDIQVFVQESKTERDKAHLPVDSDDFCPLLVAESSLSNAENLLIDAMTPVTGLTSDQLLCHGMESYNKYVDLCLRILAHHVNKESCLTRLLKSPSTEVPASSHERSGRE